ncbi:MAG: hypothetical protein JXR70_06690 [Spirochaetales bacterium]|nr:hypothetical protein [Spirochaetales bacterium]
MDHKTKKIIWSLFSKGKKNWTEFDKILIESDPKIKNELMKLYNVDESLYIKTLNEVNRKQQAQRTSPKPVNLRLFFMAAITALLTVTIINYWPNDLNNYQSSEFLGKNLTLLITSSETPQNLLTNGQTIIPGQRLQISFQATGSGSDYKKGVVLVIDSNGKNRILYRYDHQKQSLNMIEPTIIEENFITKEGQYIFFVAYFSTDDIDINTEQIIQRLSRKNARQPVEMSSILPGNNKNDNADYLFLQGIGM